MKKKSSKFNTAQRRLCSLASPRETALGGYAEQGGSILHAASALTPFCTKDQKSGVFFFFQTTCTKELGCKKEMKTKIFLSREVNTRPNYYFIVRDDETQRNNRNVASKWRESVRLTCNGESERRRCQLLPHVVLSTA